MSGGERLPPEGRLDLDWEELFLSLDATRMRDRLAGLPFQCQEGWAQSRDCDVPPSWSGVERVVIGGMGGSAIAGDLAADLAAGQRAGPVIPVRDFSLPFSLNRHTLFVACSYSGATVETLSLFEQARGYGTPMLVVAGGGPLGQAALDYGIPRLAVSAAGEPRSAVGFTLMMLLGVLDRCGAVKTSEKDATAAMEAVAREVCRCGVESPDRINPAKELARRLQGKLVVVYGGGWLTGMARRWKTQLNENAKVWAFHETVPELLHNAVEGFDRGAEGNADKMVLVLKPNAANEQLQKRYEVTKKLLEERQVPHLVLEPEPGPPLAQILSMLALGDYVSFYLAMLNGWDPAPTPTLDLGKRLLNEGPA